jgi:hypothetical protein
MGGFGSGRKRRHALVEDYLAVDLAEFRRRDMLTSGSTRIFHWYRFDKSIIASMRVIAKADHLVLNGTRYELARTPGRFGGERLWLVCSCGRRVRILYKPRKSAEPLSCRGCLNLRYRSQTEAAYWGASRRADIMNWRLYNKISDFRQHFDRESFADRPSRMHRKTYDRLLDRFIELRIAFSTGQHESFTRAANRLNARFKHKARRNVCVLRERK